MTPEQLYWLFSAQVVLATMLGRTRHFLGPIGGAFAFVAIQEVAVHFTLYRSLVLGIMLIVVVLAFPEGLTGAETIFINKMGRARNLQGHKQSSREHAGDTCADQSFVNVQQGKE